MSLKSINRISKKGAVGRERLLPSDYAGFLAGLKTKIAEAQVRAHLSVNQELIRLYWNVGKEISVLRIWYAHQVVSNGWSRSVLVHQIGLKLHERQGRAITNFSTALPAAQSDLALQMVKDPYNFGFLALGTNARERDLELGLMD